MSRNRGLAQTLKSVDKMSTFHSNNIVLHCTRLYGIQNVNNFIYIHGCNNDVSDQS